MLRPQKPHKLWRLCLLGLMGALIAFVGATVLCLHRADNDFRQVRKTMVAINLRDRHGTPLTVSYQGRWNTTDVIQLHEVPDLLKSSFLFSEDRDFYTHGGVDWSARLGATWQNMRSGHVVRGASTISEQVVRMLYPRPRTLWSKWIEGIEASMLECSVSKADIYEFYLNQIPYAANRRGIVQAAHYYFNRDITTLTAKEMMALVVLARAPSSYDLYQYPDKITPALNRLAEGLHQNNLLDDKEYAQTKTEVLDLKKPEQVVYAQHFARYMHLYQPDVAITSLDASLQSQVQNIIDKRVEALSAKHVQNAAALVVDFQSGDILAWVVAGASAPLGARPGNDIDAVTTPRQPGSSMKPFLYAAAIEKGWNGATLLNDSPLAESVGTGLHRFRNYSNTYYGPITLREALGNSLNIPALLTIQYVGVGNYLSLLQKIGFQSLGYSSDMYDEGLALGNGEVTLLEMTTGYAVMARQGIFLPLKTSVAKPDKVNPKRIFSMETTSIIGNILSDPWARRIEFGRDSVLNLPLQTAAKTGTSTDYRDAWVFGYNDRYVVGIWMGNLDRTPMHTVTGSIGPALAMRSIFSILNRDRDTKKLVLSPRLVWQDVCVRPATDGKKCATRSELFVANKALANDVPVVSSVQKFEIIRPTEGLQIAFDPRIPTTSQKFRFELNHLESGQSVDWVLDGTSLSKSGQKTYLWPVVRGSHILQVTIYKDGVRQTSLQPVHFLVK